MNKLISFLKNNLIVISVMFIISLLSGFMTIFLGWKQFYADFLSKSITLPVYVYPILLLFVFALARMFSSTVQKHSKRLRTIKGESFGAQHVYVDGKRFVNCTFENTKLVFRGEAGSGLEGCSFTNSGFVFEGPAERTAEILASLYAVPGFRPLIENTFEAIKKGNLPRVIPPSNAADD